MFSSIGLSLIASSCFIPATSYSTSDSNKKLTSEYASANMSQNLFFNKHVLNYTLLNHKNLGNIEKCSNNLDLYGQEVYEKVSSIIPVNEINSENEFINKFNNLNDKNKIEILISLIRSYIFKKRVCLLHINDIFYGLIYI